MDGHAMYLSLIDFSVSIVFVSSTEHSPSEADIASTLSPSEADMMMLAPLVLIGLERDVVLIAIKEKFQTRVQHFKKMSFNPIKLKQ